MLPDQIIINYIQTWFIVDLAVVVPDWIFTILAMSEGGDKNSGSSVRLLRILRLARIAVRHGVGELRRWGAASKSLLRGSQRISEVLEEPFLKKLFFQINWTNL